MDKNVSPTERRIAHIESKTVRFSLPPYYEVICPKSLLCARATHYMGIHKVELKRFYVSSETDSECLNKLLPQRAYSMYFEQCYQLVPKLIEMLSEQGYKFPAEMFVQKSDEKAAPNIMTREVQKLIGTEVDDEPSFKRPRLDG